MISEENVKDYNFNVEIFNFLALHLIKEFNLGLFSCERFIYVYAHMHIMVKVISLSEEAYMKLKSIKNGRSFSETVVELIERPKNDKKNIMDFFGIWADKKEEWETIKKTLEEDRKRFKLREVKF